MGPRGRLLEPGDLQPTGELVVPSSKGPARPRERSVNLAGCPRSSQGSVLGSRRECSSSYAPLGRSCLVLGFQQPLAPAGD